MWKSIALYVWRIADISCNTECYKRYQFSRNSENCSDTPQPSDAFPLAIGQSRDRAVCARVCVFVHVFRTVEVLEFSRLFRENGLPLMIQGIFNSLLMLNWVNEEFTRTSELDILMESTKK